MFFTLIKKYKCKLNLKLKIVKHKNKIYSLFKNMKNIYIQKKDKRITNPLIKNLKKNNF